MSRGQELLFGGRGATITPCQRYRTVLWREWGDLFNRCVFIMLNPSTADGLEDDPTIRRCVDFATSWGHGALDVVNLFSFRATEPEMLIRISADPIGPAVGNASKTNPILEVIARSACRRIVPAWGTSGNTKLRKMIHARAHEVRFWIDETRRYEKAPPVECLGLTQDGQPKHPLYIPKSIVLTPFPRREEA